ncbi:MAG: M91 family zinc metallopeptidase [Bryobacteraceae bacterium]
MHVCPMVTPGTPPVPHVGGPVLPPCFVTVMTMGPPDARIMDMCTCVGPPDPISQGSSTVLVGGMPTSRMGDATSHGGALVVGAPTVLVGGPPVTLAVAPGQTPAFVAALQAALSTILPTRSGVEWLRQMGVNGRTVTFQETATANGFCTPANGANAGNGTGTNSTIDWNPTHNVTDSGLPGAQGTPGANVILAHEMVHALHNANGNESNGPNDNFPGQSGTSARNEERSTVGTGGSPINTPTGPQANPPDYSGNVPTENSFRDDLGIPRRPTYYPSNWPGGPPW